MSKTRDQEHAGHVADVEHGFDELIGEIRAAQPVPEHEPDWAAMQRAIDTEVEAVEATRARRPLARLRAWLATPWGVGSGLAAAAAVLALALVWPPGDRGIGAVDPPIADNNIPTSTPDVDGVLDEADLALAFAPTVHDLDDDQLDLALDATTDSALADPPGYLAVDLFAEASDEEPFGPPNSAADLQLDHLSDEELDELAAIFAG